MSTNVDFTTLLVNNAHFQASDPTTIKMQLQFRAWNEATSSSVNVGNLIDSTWVMDPVNPNCDPTSSECIAIITAAPGTVFPSIADIEAATGDISWDENVPNASGGYDVYKQNSVDLNIVMTSTDPVNNLYIDEPVDWFFIRSSGSSPGMKLQ